MYARTPARHEIKQSAYKNKKKEKRDHARFVRASIDSGARAIPKCSKSSTQRLSSESFELAAVLSSVLQRIGIGCGWASNVSRRAASRSACSFESAGTLSAAVSACSGSIDAMGYCCSCEDDDVRSEMICAGAAAELLVLKKLLKDGDDERRSV
jgi:hypothetical protein